MYRLDELVERLGGSLHGDPAVRVGRVAAPEQAGEGDLAFLVQRKFLARLRDCAASAIIVAPALQAELAGHNCIVVDDPYLYFARAAQLFNPSPLPSAGVHRSASVASDLPASVEIGAAVCIEEDVVLGEDVIIGAGCFIGRGSRIGCGSRLAARVVVYHGSVIGERCIVHSGAVIGSDGFGFARAGDGSWVKIPQTGRVVIGDEVEIGANTTIDRGALDDTVIGDGCKLDNQIQVAHNVRIGEHTAIAGCVGIAGSTLIGARCMIGGQAGITGHLSICDDVVVSAGTLVSKSINRPGVYTANLPLQAHADWMRNFAHLRQLDNVVARLRQLESARPAVVAAPPPEAST